MIRKVGEEMSNQFEVVLYLKENCQLCDMAKAILLNLSDEFPITIREVDIYQDDELLLKYQLQIPVVEFAGEEMESGLIHGDIIRKRLQQKIEAISVE